MEKEQLKEEKYRKVHYFFVGKNYKKTLKKIDENLKFFRLERAGKFRGKEIIYDVLSNMLSKSGLVLSKQLEDGTTLFKLRKISTLPSLANRPSNKFELRECRGNETPRDFALQIASAISNSFSTTFTVDLVPIVKQTMPKIQIDVRGKKYRIVGGTGYECYLLYEKSVYRDLITMKKVKRNGFTLRLPKDEKSQRENEEILDLIERHCKELVRYTEGRFEIAQRVLYPKPIETPKPTQEEDEKES